MTSTAHSPQRNKNNKGLTIYYFLVTRTLMSIAVGAIIGSTTLYLAKNNSFAIASSVLVCIISIALCLYYFTKKLCKTINALNLGLLNLIDSDYSTNLCCTGITELEKTISSFNTLTETLRVDRQTLYQRELLLNTILENSNMSVLIVDQSNRIMYSNSQTRRWLNEGKSIQGLDLDQAFHALPNVLTAVHRKQSGIFTLSTDSNRLYYLLYGEFQFNANRHSLIMLREMTQELGRQEILAWKKVIRVISHELNNSLAPISSLSHSGKILVSKGQYEKLPDVFSTLIERSKYLTAFVGKYAEIAKLPAPIAEDVSWGEFIQSLKEGYPFSLVGNVPPNPSYFDPSQMHQVLQNLLKNAEESGSKREDIQLEIQQTKQHTTVYVLDRGQGLPEQQLKQALLPFYSTKLGGSGTGLALCREIIDAHNGKMSLSNRTGGGVEVMLQLPNKN